MCPALAIADVQGLALSGERDDVPHASRATATVGAGKWIVLTIAGLLQCVFNTTQNTRAPSTRFLYESKWVLF